CYLDDRPKRSRRGQSIAGAGRNADGDLVQERRDERRLAGARLTTDERERACSRSGVLEVCRQRRELRLALDQLHDRDGKKRSVLRSMACAQYAGCASAKWVEPAEARPPWHRAV